MNTDIKYGKILISDPYLTDFNFERTVIFLTDHHPEGSVGFILNNKTEFKINDLIEGFGECDFPVYYGGPVKTDIINYIHKYGDLVDDSYYVKDGIYWGGDFNMIKELINDGIILSEGIKFFIGYSGWEKNQLKEELIEKTWILSDVEMQDVFKDNSNLWKQILKNIGGHYSVIAEIPKSNFLN